jgi:hypothetical protein
VEISQLPLHFQARNLDSLTFNLGPSVEYSRLSPFKMNDSDVLRHENPWRVIWSRENCEPPCQDADIITGHAWMRRSILWLQTFVCSSSVTRQERFPQCDAETALVSWFLPKAFNEAFSTPWLATLVRLEGL